jgi:hypothetical protein
MTLQLVLQLLKLGGVAISSISGALATAFETKTEIDGGKRINKVGIILLVLIIVGALISAAAQIVEDDYKAVEARTAAIQHSNDLRLSTILCRQPTRLRPPSGRLHGRMVLK